MRGLIADWVGKRVHVTTRVGGLPGTVPQQGTLLKVCDGGVLLQLEKGQTYFPVYSILHVSLVDDK